ncbi:HilA/EilA family virulence transcriptional regulator [Chromobacterium sp. IIBBL 290-4]|uniref:HilA/EilA family virulence transcriptional regulator n=1 Tax=Chromobacterium sp. IIBBL 290-4 TaxID=2953890 RepID=UPI0020B7C069|nr:HilA/EilA family virulence transcriptional regulator [Chromobacterium sp. IIBBL 290-4]UTH74113.1 HilA/EilA family virulence transcriptional regulator [Chromobacterium sp. IIBBL 290-4]
MVNKDGFIHRQFVFGDFILHFDGRLTHCGQPVGVPPKELAVLTALLEAAGELVSKDALLERAWPGGEVSEESLTRCICALRRILLENKEQRYIDTVYGKGYRFCRPVAVVARQEETISSASVAVLPFRAEGQLDTQALHGALVQNLVRYLPFGLRVLPATLTRDCQSLSDLQLLMEQLSPDYYLAGQAQGEGEAAMLRVELIRSPGHQLVHHESIALAGLHPAALQARLSDLLARQIAGQRGDQTRELDSLGSAIPYLNAMRELQQHTPSSLRRALSQLHQCVERAPGHAPSWRALAECYLALAQLSLFDQEQAMRQAKAAVDKAVELDAAHPQTLGLLALLGSLRGEYALADALLEQARLLAPQSVELHYYRAWHLFLAGRLELAQGALDASLARDPSRIAPGILKLWLTFYQSRIDEAVTLGYSQLRRYGQQHPVLQNLLALMLSQQQRHDEAQELVRQVQEAGEEDGLLEINRRCVEYARTGDNARQSALQIDSRQVRASLLPLVLAREGRESAIVLLRQLQDGGYPWLAAWRHDPRLAELFREPDMANDYDRASGF